ncbi:MAG: hypothetical protein AAFY03_07325, partial [Pseudomonadota bacterium]
MPPDDLQPVGAWRLHLGVHKTATTHMQDTLLAVRGVLADRGVDALPNQDIRNALFPVLTRRNPRLWLGGVPMRRALERAIAEVRIGPATVLISEENLLGHASTILGKEI